jgi:hypothetical protein
MVGRFGLRKAAGSGLAVVAALGLGFALVAPTKAQSAVQQLISFACFDHQQCLSITNAAPDGKAIVGVARNNSAIVGRINPSTDPQPFGNAGVLGIDASTSLHDSNQGVLGISANGSGGIFMTSFDSSLSGAGQTGIGGFDNSATVNENSGVAGVSTNNCAVCGFAGPGLPPPPDCTGNDGCVNSGIAVWGENDTGVGTVGTGALVVVAIGQDNAHPSLLIVRFSPLGPSPLIRAYGGPDGTTRVMSLDNSGNLTLTGKLIQHGTPTAVAATSRGNQVVTFAPQQSIQTMEDVGEAQLIGGQAVVRLEPAFASTIDTRRSYLVFITPQGESNSLYVTQKTAGGFVVRERNGASNIAFDYRIVAQPYGQAVAQRLAAFTGTNDAAASAAELRTVRRLVARGHATQVRLRQAHRHIIH